MPELCTFEYCIIRVVPRVEREEFLNVGVLLSCATHEFLQARIEVDRDRLKAFSPALDFLAVEEYLRSIPLVCAGGAEAGPLGQLPQRARFHWLAAARSTIIQTSPIHSGLCECPHATLERLLDTMVRVPLKS
ncbi:MAG TPA: DUF3037 domain-containing protein [Abditibacteriaceae bacterium]|nr:DUF3037 domain-containing protein [Abditibacteriaceae bacterium]